MNKEDRYCITNHIKRKDYEKDKEINQAIKEGMLMKWYHLLLIAAACVLSFLCGTRVRKTPVTNTEIKKVVEYRYDTIIREKPVYITKYVKSFMLIPAKDTVNIHDTTFVYVPREYKVYQDSSYRAVVSGYDPRLDSIEIYYPTKIVTITKTKENKWHFGLQGGIGVTKNGLSYYLGFGGTYSFYSF